VRGGVTRSAGGPARPVRETTYNVSVTLERTVRAKHDLDWLPPSFRAIRWAVAGTIWTGIGALLTALLMFAKHGFYFYGKGIAVLFAGGYVAGDRAAKAVLRGRLGKLAHGQVDLARLKQEADGELVHVRGRVKARETVGALLGDQEARGVYRRVVFSVGTDRWVHEAAVDFQLVDEQGERVMVEVEGARLVTADPKRRRIEGERAREVFELTLDPALRTRPDGSVRVGRADKGVIVAGEILLQDGDEVEVVGYKSRSVDPSIESRLERDTPMRATLRAGRELPLIVSPLRK